jgi:hypothetical protein
MGSVANKKKKLGHDLYEAWRQTASHKMTPILALCCQIQHSFSF